MRLLLCLLLTVVYGASELPQSLSTAPAQLTTEEFFLAAGIPREGLGWIVRPVSPIPVQTSVPVSRVNTVVRSFSPKVDIYGNKTIEFNNYKHRGDFNQFVQNNPQAITDAKFEQHTRVTIQGEIQRGTHIHAVFDDSADRDVDDKILLGIRGRHLDLQLGRIDLKLDGPKYVLHNKKALGIALTHRGNKLSSSFLVARSEGVEEREQFFGQGVQREYILKKAPIVPGSDRITLDGRLLTAGVDYRVDYESGTLQFEQTILPIESTESIIVEYESMRDGNAFKNRIFSLREHYRFDEDNQIGMTWALSKDQISQDLMTIGGVKPASHTILGIDGRIKGSKGMYAEFELARSVKNQDIVSGLLPTLKGSVIDLSFGQKGKYHSLKLTKQRFTPEFRSIGRDAFLTIGEDSGLVGDIDQNALELQWQKGKTSFTQLVSASKTNLENDPTKDTTDFFMSSASLNSKLGRLPVRAGYKNENRPTLSGAGVKEYRTIRKQNAGASWDMRPGLRADVDVDKEENLLRFVNGSQIESASLGLSSRGSEHLAWNYMYKHRDTVDAITELPSQSSKDHQLNLNFKPHRDIQAQIEFLHRAEDDFATRETLIGSASGVDIRYRLGRKLDYSLKAREELKRRIVLESSNLNLVDLKNPDRRKDYVTPNNPVQTFTTSQILRYEQNRHLDHRISFRTMDEEERVIDKPLASHDDFSYDLRWNLPRDFRLKLRAGHRDRFNLASALDQKIADQEAELTRSFGNKWQLTTRALRQKDHDLSLKSMLGLQESEIKLDRQFHLSLRAYTSLIMRSFGGREDRDESQLGTGIVYTPEASDFRLSVDLSQGKSEDNLTNSQSDLRKVQVSLQKEIFRDATLEGLFKHEVEAPSSKGTGYTGSVYNVRVSMDF